MENLITLWASSGVAQIELGQIVMMGVGLGLLFLAINKGFEPLLLVPIGFGTVLANIPGAGFDAAISGSIDTSMSLAHGFSTFVVACGNKAV